jgi:hypothetical protein
MKNLPAMKVKGCWYAARWHFRPEVGNWGINVYQDNGVRYWMIVHARREDGNSDHGFYLYEITNGGGTLVPCCEGKPFRTLREAQEASYDLFRSIYDVEFVGGNAHGFAVGEEIKPWHGK